MNHDLNLLRGLVDELSLRLSSLEHRRFVAPFANDLFEAASYWRDLGTFALDRNTKVDYPVVARSEIREMEHLKTISLGQPHENQDYYAPIFQIAGEILDTVEKIQPPSDGHLGVLRIIHEQFAFLEADYGFHVTEQKPTGLRLSTGEVYIELAWAKQWSNSCVFGPDSPSQESFWIKDLLFMHSDQRYRTLPEELTLDTESAVEGWFRFLAGVFKQYGRDVFTNRPGIFAKLAKAREEWDREYTKEMDRLYGNR
jgi:hypothetical protein